jgi:hypothetical protein
MAKQEHHARDQAERQNGFGNGSDFDQDVAGGGGSRIDRRIYDRDKLTIADAIDRAASRSIAPVTLRVSEIGPTRVVLTDSPS